MSFGPYTSLAAGRYIAGYYIRRIGPLLSGNIVLDVYVNGRPHLAEKIFAQNSLFEDLASLVYLPFQLSEATSQLEVRVHVDEGVLIELRDFVLFSADPRVWSSS